MKSILVKTAAFLFGAFGVLWICFVAGSFNNPYANAATMTDAEARKQLALESQNLVAFGNPFGVTGKFEELYDPTGKPWWMVQLAKEAWSMETYGNPFGYFIPQRALQSYVPIPIVDRSRIEFDSNSQNRSGESAATPEVRSVGSGSSAAGLSGESTSATPSFVSIPYFVSTAGQVAESAIAKGVAVRFSEVLPADGPRPESYLLACVNSDGRVNINTERVASENGYVRVAFVTDGNGLGHYSCKFRYTDPVVVESEVIEFDLWEK